MDSSILSLGTGSTTLEVDRNARRRAYLAAYQAAGLTHEQAAALQAEVETLGRSLGLQIRSGALSPADAIQRVRRAFDIAPPAVPVARA